jgi:hypothetical protein
MNVAPITTSTSSQETWNLALKWIDDCRENHPSCREAVPRSGWNPTRLLDVGTLASPILRLYQSSSTQEELVYTTLSHCWGKIPIHRLLLSNFEAMKAVVDPAILTNSFRDASQGLGYSGGLHG